MTKRIPTNARADTIALAEVLAPPEDYGEECPVCGDPFDVDASGVVWATQETSSNVFPWVRVCTGPAPKHCHGVISGVSDHPPESHAFLYVHRDEHVDGDSEGGS